MHSEYCGMSEFLRYKTYMAYWTPSESCVSTNFCAVQADIYLKHFDFHSFFIYLFSSSSSSDKDSKTNLQDRNYSQLYLLLCSVSLQDVDRHGAPQHRILCDFVCQSSRPKFYIPFTQHHQVGGPLSSPIPLGFDISSENGIFPAFLPHYLFLFYIEICRITFRMLTVSS